MSSLLAAGFLGIEPWVWLQHLPSLVFVIGVGAAVGSFSNVVVHRLPMGMSVIHPPSRCPTCGARLRFFRENVPVLGWFMVRGRCRRCGARVSPRYMLVELAMAIAFAGLYVLLFLPPRGTWLAEVGGPWWVHNQFFLAWPAFFAVAFLLAGLAVMTVIDARTFTIPIQIPVFVTVAALALWLVQVLLPFRDRGPDSWPLPGTGWGATGAAVLGGLGVLLSTWRLRSGRLPWSFADYDDYVEEGETLGDYPHARREMGLELRCVLPIVVGIGVGAFAGPWLGDALGHAVPPRWLQALGAPLLGYLVAGGTVWAIRILGTLGFGREAMGMGDVHLMGAAGAVLGWLDPLLAFFVAPFSGLAWVAAGGLVGRLLPAARRELPYGPHLAVAVVAVALARPGIDRVSDWYLGRGLPERGFVEPAVDASAVPSPGRRARPRTGAEEAGGPVRRLAPAPGRSAGDEG